MARPAPPSLTDYAVTAVSPALNMAMVGSLVFFLIEVLYQGNYSDRLLWTMFCFVAGTVLIARILILHGANRALIYAAGLAAATFLALQAFVDYPNLTMRSFGLLVNAALMALIWWSANKLTWDCTHIDEDRQNAGRGVLDAATHSEIDDEPPPKTPDAPGAQGWYQRWRRHRDRQNKKPHTPGVWVLYFSLAALPLFGLGQSLIPTADESRRRFTFQLMAIYVGSGLGLLATTTLLGLRKYLRDRGAVIPAKMTAGWLGIAAAIIAAFLAIAAVLPRPYTETPLINLPKLAASKDRDASKNAQVKDGSHGEGDGSDGTATKNDPKAERQKSGEKGDGQREDQSKEGGGRGQGESKSAGTKSGEKRESQESRGGEKKETSGGESKSETPSANKLGSALEKAGSLIKWLAWIVIALLVIAAIAIFILRYLAPFTSWARKLLDWLKGLWKKKVNAEKADTKEVSENKEMSRPPPFSAFADPFQNGSRMPVEEMVSYSFKAFESWAWDRGAPRQPDETPFEFARRIESETGFDGQPLVRLYGQVLYSDAELQATSTGTVKEFWQRFGK